jgi:ribosomal protein S8
MTTDSLAHDLLNGPKEIAAFTGFSEHAVRHYVRNQTMPAFRAGTRIMSRKSSILSWIEAQEAKSKAPALSRKVS